MPQQTLTDSKHALLCATERLYVEVGPSVSLREIAQAAGQRNNSAVNYHFGSRAGLESAVLRYRTTAMEAERAEQRARLPDPVTLEGLVATLVDPLLSTPYVQGSTHYARFAEMVRSFVSMQTELADVELWAVSRGISGEIVRRLDHLDRVDAWGRMEAMTTTLFSLAADRERARFSGAQMVSAHEITRMLVGLLRG